MLPVKSNRLNQPPVVNVGMAAPPVIRSVGALLELPPVVPKVNVAVTPMELVKPPGPESVNPVAVAILNLVVAAVVWPRLIYPPENGLKTELETAPDTADAVIVKLYVDPSVNDPETVFNSKLVCVPVMADMLVPEL